MIGEPIFCMDLERPWIHLDQRISCLVGWKRDQNMLNNSSFVWFEFLLDFFVGSEGRDDRMNWNLDFFSMHSKWISLTSGVGSHGFTREMKPGYGIVFCWIST